MHTQYTPGPWRVNGTGIDEQTIVADGKAVADIPTDAAAGLSDTEIFANARLIAAAPELLEALKECLNQLRTNDMHSNTVYQHLSNERRNMLSAAQVKARATIPKVEAQS